MIWQFSRGENVGDQGVGGTNPVTICYFEIISDPAYFKEGAISRNDLLSTVLKSMDCVQSFLNFVKADSSAVFKS
jgi:hypothetical protein